MMPYGAPIRDGKGDLYQVSRDGRYCVVSSAEPRPQPVLRICGYPALAQLIARLSEVAKEMAREK